MPFHNNVYYPLPLDPQGAHSSAGIPSLLSSPQTVRSSGTQSRPTGSAMSGALSCGAASVPAPFKFRVRRESVDWRRINAVDVDQVACALDFQTLQDHITAVTFCNIERERCPCCQSQMDPSLLKLFRLAQLTVEYLLHSQDCLTLSLQATEERLQAEAQEREQLVAQLQKQTQDVKSLKEELRQRKKIIASQQAMITAGIASYHKCQHCEKAFMNESFLQSHMERRHPMENDIKLVTENQKKVQTMKLQDEISRLQEQLTLARSQMEMQQKDYSAKQEKDLTQKQEEFMKQLEIWKADERVCMNRKIDEVKQSCQREMDSLHQRNRNLETEVLKLQQSSKTHGMQTVQVQAISEQNFENQPLQDVIQLQQKLQKQEMEWTAKMQKMKEEYEKSLVKATQANSSSFGKETQRQIQEMKLMLQEQQQIIHFSSKQMRQSSSNPHAAVVQSEVVVPPAPESKSKVVVNDSTSISESPPDVHSWQHKAEDLLNKPGLKRGIRMVVQETLHDKLLSLGIQPGAGELCKTTYKSAMDHVVSVRQQKQGKIPAYCKVQKEVWRNLEQRLKKKNSEQPSSPKQPVQAMTVGQSKTQSSCLPITVASSPPQRQQYTPQPAHRTRTLSRTSTPVQKRATLFSSDQDTSEEEGCDEESPQAPKGSQVKATTGKSQLPRAQLFTSLEGVSSFHALAPHSVALQSSGQVSDVHQAPVVSVNRRPGTVVESESEWTDGSEMEEIALEQLQKHTDQNGNVHKISHKSVNVVKNLEPQLTEHGLTKTTESINSIPGKCIEVLNTKELKDTEVNDDDDDDWDISSLEDIHDALKSSPAPLRKSTDKSVDSSTSVWDTFTCKVQKPGLNEAGTGSTLKSSIVTVSDWDDSSDI